MDSKPRLLDPILIVCNRKVLQHMLGPRSSGEYPKWRARAGARSLGWFAHAGETDLGHFPLGQRNHSGALRPISTAKVSTQRKRIQYPSYTRIRDLATSGEAVRLC